MSDSERRLLAEQKKVDALRARIVATSYMKASEVRDHLRMSQAVLNSIPFPVLPWTPGPGRERVERRYHPADVAAYPARARRHRNAIEAHREPEVLAEMSAELDARDRALIGNALGGVEAA